MKTLALIKVFFFLFLTTGILQAQDVIYSEDFNDDIGKGFDGDGLSDISDVNWILDVSACVFTGAGDYVKVVATGNDRLEAVDCDGEAIWRSSIIDISAHTGIAISILASETGSGSNAANKYIKLYYILDGGSETSFFESTVDWSSATAAITNLNGSSLQIVARMKTTYASDKIYIDDISVTGTPVTITKDALTQVLDPDIQVPSQNINSTINDLSSAQALLKFKLSEPSGSDDLDTKIASVKFTNVATGDKADLSSQFQDFALHDGTDFITISSLLINANEIIMNFIENDFNLPDDSSHEYELRGYLKSIGIGDGQKVQMQLSAGAADITTYDVGSGFDAANSLSVSSPEHQISVEATDLNYTLSPTSDILKNSNFSVSLNATDKNGNLDSDANQSVSLNLETGSGILSGELINSLIQGNADFTNLSYNQAENIKIQASAAGLTPVISNPISIISSQSTDLSLTDWVPSNSKISSLFNSEDDALEIFRFSVNDIGDDLESTFLSSIWFVPGNNNNVNWEEAIGGFVIKSGDIELDASVVFNQLSLDIGISDTELFREITDGTSRDYSILVYLKTKLTDGQILQLKIENTIEGWETEGSGLVHNLIGSLTGPEFSIDVEGTHLHFNSIPTVDVAFASIFQVGTELTDVNGNIDSDANQDISLSVVDGNGVLSGTLTKPLISGSLVFEDLSYNFSELIQLSIMGDGLISEESERINILPSKSTIVELVDWLPNNLIISSLAVSSDDYKEVFRFRISDVGDDQESTVLKTIRLIPSPNNTLDWEDEISSFSLKIDNELAAVEFVKTKQYLEIIFPESLDLRLIDDDTSKEFSLFLYLNDSSTDGAIFQVAINNIHPQWEVEGSHFVDEFIGDLMGDSFVVDVLGTELVFTDKPPKIIAPNEGFEIGLKAIDEYGNQDLNSLVDASVSLASGSGELSSISGLSTGLIAGQYTWTDLIYNEAENFTILIEADGMSSILSDNISSLDINSLIVPSSSSIQSKALNPMATSPDNSEVIFSFGINDFGSLDDMPTIINTIKFYNKLSEEGLDWKKHLAGSTLLKDGQVIAKTSKIEKDYISFTSLDLEIDNASLSEFQLAIFFKKSMLPDKSQIQVEIRKKHGWKASSTASNLTEELTDNISSEIHYLEVEADRMCFISVPRSIKDSEPFRIEIAAVDEYQNIDIDNNSEVNLSLEDGDGSLSHTGMVGSLSNGILIIDDVTYSGNDLFEVGVNGNLNPCVVPIFVQEGDLIFSDDFESTDLSKWENTPDWKASAYLPINGNSSLKHNLSNAIGSSYIICPLVDLNLKSESIFWEFTLKNSDWDPSSTNNFVLHLLVDSNAPDLENTLFSVGVNFTGTDDLLSLWRTQYGESERLLKSDFDWNEEETIAVKIEYTAKGEWKLFYNRMGEMKNWYSVGTVISEPPLINDTWYSALEFQFETASRAGQLWFDDLIIESLNTAPYFKSYTIASDSIILNFSEDLNFMESSKPGNFQLTREDDLVPIKMIKESSANNQLILFMETDLLTGNYLLIIDGMVDVKGAISKTETVKFKFFAETKVHDLIINEILADENPIVGLPEYEFIEIFNSGDYSINIKDYKLQVGNSEVILSDYEIQAQDYLILCSNAALELYKEFGYVLGVSSFPSLTNSGNSISLESSSGVLLDEVTYSSDWYGDDNKKDGGWSLERIDASNFCSTVSNWSASISDRGGSPGQDNSIKGIYEDTLAPDLISHLLISNQDLQLEFSEALIDDAALLYSNYTLEGNSISSIVKESSTVLQLHLTDALQDGVNYKLILNNLIDECGNFQEISVDIVWHDVHKHELVINEILADESPAVALPEYEFVEIFNTSEHSINLKDYKLYVGENEKTLSDFELPSHDYLILCSNAALEFYKEFGNTIGVSSFPSLTNSGTSISLESSSGVLLDEVAYSSGWYSAEEKSNGGWSLERIDVNNHSWQADNWRASLDELGGTPGTRNSVEAFNPDLIPPRLLSHNVSAASSIDLFFSEPLDLGQALILQNYSINSDVRHPNSIIEIENEIFALRLLFSSEFKHNLQYQISLSDQLLDLAGNSIAAGEIEFLLADMPQEGDLVINEVLFNPYPGGSDYIELLNVSDQIIDIRDIFIANRDENYQLDALYQLTTESRILDVGAYLLLCSDTLSVKENYSYFDENAFMQINKMPSYNDDEGRVVILNSTNELLDDFAYDENMHFQGLTSTEGVALERINPDNETNSLSNWTSAAQSIGFGTPGLKNSSYDIDETEVSVVGFKKKIFSPDSDGVDDRLIINFDLKKSGYVANIRVYNSFGREVRRLASNLTLSTQDELFWDGLLASKVRAPIGVYVFYFELFHPDGDVKTYKKTCVLGGKMK